MKKLLIGCAIGLGVASCTAPRMRVNANYGQEINHPEHRLSYYIVDGTFEGWDSTTVRPAMYAAIDRHLTLLGYDAFRAASPYQPVADIMVYCSVHERDLPITEVERVGSSYPVEYRKSKTMLSGGSLIIQLFDTRSKRIFWFGYATNLKADQRFSESEVVPQAAATVIDRFRTIPEPHYLDAEVAPSFVRKK